MRTRQVGDATRAECVLRTASDGERRPCARQRGARAGARGWGRASPGRDGGFSRPSAELSLSRCPPAPSRSLGVRMTLYTCAYAGTSMPVHQSSVAGTGHRCHGTSDVPSL